MRIRASTMFLCEVVKSASRRFDAMATVRDDVADGASDLVSAGSFQYPSGSLDFSCNPQDPYKGTEATIHSPTA
jgi:hypothetical protein